MKHSLLYGLGLVLVGGLGVGTYLYLSQDSWENRKQSFAEEMYKEAVSKGVPEDVARKASTCLANGMLDAAAAGNCPLESGTRTEALLIQCFQANPGLVVALFPVIMTCAEIVESSQGAETIDD